MHFREKKKEEKPVLSAVCPNSLGLLILSQSISELDRENEVPECFAEGVSGFDRLAEICSALPFFIMRAGTKNANMGFHLKRLLEM